MVVYAEQYVAHKPAPKPPVARFPLAERLAERRFKHASHAVTKSMPPASEQGNRPSALVGSLTNPSTLHPQRPTSSARSRSPPLSVAAAEVLPSARSAVVLPAGCDVAEVRAPTRPPSATYVRPAAFQPPQPAPASEGALQRFLSERKSAEAATVTQRQAVRLALQHITASPPAAVEPPAVPGASRAAAIHPASKEELYRAMFDKFLVEERAKLAEQRPRFQTVALRCPNKYFGFPANEMDPEFEDDIRRDDFLFARRAALEEAARTEAQNRIRVREARKLQHRRHTAAFRRMLAINEASTAHKCSALLQNVLEQYEVPNPSLTAAALTARIASGLASPRDENVATARGKQSQEHRKHPTPRQRDRMVAEFDPSKKRPAHVGHLTKASRDIVEELAPASRHTDRVPRFECQTLESAEELHGAMWIEAQLEALQAAADDSDSSDGS